MRFGGSTSNDIQANDRHTIASFQHAIIQRHGDREEVRISAPPPHYLTNIIRHDGQAGGNVYMVTTMRVGDRVRFGSNLDDIFELALKDYGNRRGFVPPSKLSLRPKAQQQPQPQKQKQDNRNNKNDDNKNKSGGGGAASGSGGGTGPRNLLFKWINMDGE